jgi:hypothetical protein
MKDPKVISTNPPSVKSMDYNFLRLEGIKTAQELSGDIWTDYNYHDPGVTMLEQLCYAITDLGYRTNFPIEDLLQTKTDDYDVRKQNVLYPPSSILTCNPITVTDFRKLIIDGVPEVTNAWLEPIKDHPLGIKGLYRAHIQLDEGIETEEVKVEVSNKIRKIFNENRNLCEDIEGVYVLTADIISIAARIEISSEEIGEDILAKILLGLEQYINPYIPIYSVEQLLAEGKNINEIFDGPLPFHGFIKTEDLRPMNREIYISQIKEIILRMTGVRSVSYLEVRRNGIKVHDDVLTFEDANYPLLIPDMQLPSDKIYPVQFTKNGIPYRLDTSLAMQLYETQKANSQKEYKVKLKLDEEIPKAKASKSDISSYYSIQREFPNVYGINENGLPARVNRKREAQAQQLKAYLLFFEQHMANHLAQLANVKHLFSIDENLEQTYFTQVPNNIPHLFGRDEKPLEDIFANTEAEKDFVKRFKAAFYEILREFNIKGKGRLHLIDYLLEKYSIEYDLLASAELHYDLEIYIENFIYDFEVFGGSNRILIEQILTSFRADQLSLVDARNEASFQEELEFLGKEIYDHAERRNRSLDHLLARFGEHFYTDLLMQFNILDSNEEDLDSVTDSVQAKINFLKNYEELSQNRGSGYDYLKDSIETKNVSGLKKRICLLLNINDYSEKKLTTLINDFELYQRKRNNVNITEKTMKIDEKRTKTVAALSSKNYRSNRFTFHSTNKDILGELLTFGTKKDNYEMQTQNNGTIQVSFAKPGNQRRVKVYEGYNEDECDEMVEKLIDKLNDINEVSEGFYLIEHILLRPLHQTLYKYNLFGAKGNPIIESYQPGSWETQKYITDDLILVSTKANNYSIVLNEAYTYDVILYDEIHQPVGRVLVEDDDILETRADAMDYIDKVVAYLDRFKRGQGNISSIIEIVREKGRFEVDIDTFFSQRCTMILPSWSARFNNRDFRSLLEMVVAENAPLHINIDLVWLDIYDMQDFEKRYEKWLDEKQKPVPVQPLLDDLAMELTHSIKDFKEKAI